MPTLLPLIMAFLKRFVKNFSTLSQERREKGCNNKIFYVNVCETFRLYHCRAKERERLEGTLKALIFHSNITSRFYDNFPTTRITPCRWCFLEPLLYSQRKHSLHYESSAVVYKWKWKRRWKRHPVRLNMKNKIWNESSFYMEEDTMV